MKKVKLIIVLSVVLGIGGCKYCGNQHISKRSFSLKVDQKDKELFLAKKSNTSTQLFLTVIPHPEDDKDMQFKVSGYSLSGGKGKLLDEKGAVVSVGDEIQRGENSFTYIPECVAKHDLKIEVSDDQDEVQQNASFRLDVKEKRVRFKVELQEVEGKKWIFPYQQAHLHVELTPIDEEASKLEYTIKALSVGKGKLLTKGGEELREGSKLEFKGHDLIFMPNGEVGSASIKMVIENEEGGSGNGSVTLEIKPVNFDLNSSLKIMEQSGVEQTEVSMSIPCLGNDLDKEAFKVVGVEFSDRVSRKLQSEEGNDLVGSKLWSGSKYTFFLPVQKVGDGVKMKMSLEGAGGVYEKEVNFSDMQQQALTKKGKEALETVKERLSKAQELLAAKVEGSSYEKVSSGEEKIKKDMTDVQKNILKLEELGLDKQGVDALKKEEEKLISQLERVEVHSKKISEKKFAFDTQLIALKSSIFPYQKAEVDLEISSLEKENKTAVYTINHLSPTRGKLKFSDGREVKEGAKIAFGKKKLVFEPSRGTGKETIGMVVESDKGTSSQAKLELDIKPVEFDLKAAFELLDLEKGEVKVWIPNTGSDLDNEKFKISNLEFSDGVQRPLTATSLLALSPGNEWKFSMNSQKLGEGVKLKARIEGAGDVHEKELSVGKLYKGALLLKQAEVQKEMRIIARDGEDLLLRNSVENYEEVVRGEERLQKELREMVAKTQKLEAIGLEETSLLTLKGEIKKIEDKISQVQELVKALAKKKFAFEATLIALKSSIFPYQEAEIELGISSFEQENKTSIYTINHLSPTKGKLKFSDGSEVKEGDKIPFGPRKLVFEPSGGTVKEMIEKIEIVLESDKGTSSQAKLELDIKPVEFDLKAAFELLDLDKGEVKVWIPTTGGDLDKEKFKVVGVAFSDSLSRNLLSGGRNNLVGSELMPGPKYAFSLPAQKIADGVKMKVKLEGAGDVYEKEFGVGEIYKGALFTKQAEVQREMRTLARDGEDLLLRNRVENYEEVVKGEEKLQKGLREIVAKTQKLEVIGLEETPLSALKGEISKVEDKISQVQELVKALAKKKFAFEATLIAPKRSIFPYQQAEIELGISSFEQENKTSIYTINHLSPTKGKLKFSDGSEVKEGAKIAFGKKKLVFEPSRGTGKKTIEKIEIVLESDKGTSSQAELELEINPVEFDLKGSLELLDLEKGEVKVWIPNTGSDLDKEKFKIGHLEFSDGVSRPLTATSLAALSPGNEWKFSMNSQKLGEGVKLKARIEGAGDVYEKEIGFRELYKGALLSKQAEVLKEMKALTGQARDLLLRNSVENYEEVVKGEEKLQKELGEMVAKTQKLEAIGLEGTSLSALKSEIKEIEDKTSQAQDLVKVLAKKKFDFKTTLQVEKEETFPHIPVPLRLTLTSREAGTQRINHRIKNIVVTKGKVRFKQGGEVVIGSNVVFGDNELLFMPSGEKEEAKIKMVIENEKGADEMVEATIKVKPIAFNVHVSSFEVKGQSEGYGKLELRIETDKQLEQESYKVSRWQFKKDNRDRDMENKVSTEEFRRFKENMCLLVAGGREEGKLDTELVKLEGEKRKLEEDKSQSTSRLNKFSNQAQNHQRQLEGILQGVKMLEYTVEKEKTSSGALTIATKYSSLEKVKLLEVQKMKTVLEKERFEAVALVQKEQNNRDEKIFNKEMRKKSDRKDIILGKKRVWQDLKQVRDRRFSEEVRPELLNVSKESRGSYELSGTEKDMNIFYLKLIGASMPSILVVTVEGPGGLSKEVEVNIRGGVEERVSSKVGQVIKNLTDLGKVMDQKLRGDSNGQKYEELTSYISTLEGEIKTALAPLRDSYGEDWWTNPRFMEIQNSKELTDIVLRTMEKLKNLDEKKENSHTAMNSFNLRIDFSLPQESRVWSEDYLDMKLVLEKVDNTMKNKVWKVLSWNCSDKAVILAGERGKILTEVLLSPDRENKLHVKFPNVGYGNCPKLKIKVGAFDGEDLIMENKVKIELEPQVKMLFEDNVGKFIEKVKAMNQRIQGCFDSKNPSDKRFDVLANLKIDAELLINYYAAKEEEVRENWKGLGVRDVAFKLTKDMERKVLEYVDVEIPKLRNYSRLLDQQKEVSQGSMTKVEELSNVEKQDSEGNFMIHKLVTNTGMSTESFKALIGSTPDINAKNKAGLTPVELLMGRRNREGWSKAQRKEYKAQKEAIRKKEKHEGENKDELKKLEMLLKAGANMNLKNKHGKSLLHMAAYRGQIERVKLLLAHGAEVNARENYGETPLHTAVVSGKTAVAELLIQAGGNLKSKNKGGYTLLHVAGDNLELINLLLKKGADVNAKANDGATPLDGALICRKKATVDLLVAHGAKINTQDKKGRSPFEEAIKKQDVEKVKLLLRAGTNPYVNEMPILLYAVIVGNKEVVQAVINFGNGNINYLLRSKGEGPLSFFGVEGHTWTALHLAAARGDKDIYKILVNAGADEGKKYEFRYDDSWMWELRTPDLLAYFCESDSKY